MIIFVSDLRQVDGFPRALRFPPPIKLTPRYNRNTVESGVKHDSPDPNPLYNAHVPLELNGIASKMYKGVLILSYSYQYFLSNYLLYQITFKTK